MAKLLAGGGNPPRRSGKLGRPLEDCLPRLLLEFIEGCPRQCGDARDTIDLPELSIAKNEPLLPIPYGKGNGKRLNNRGQARDDIVGLGLHRYRRFRRYQDATKNWFAGLFFRCDFASQMKGFPSVFAILEANEPSGLARRRLKRLSNRIIKRIVWMKIRPQIAEVTRRWPGGTL